MIFKNQEHNLTEVLKRILGINVKLHSVSNLSGGCINNAVLIKTDQGPFFVKWNRKEKHDMFLVESKGLTLLKEFSRFVIPGVLGCGVVKGRSYLILEFIERGPPGKQYWEVMGNNLAALHRNHSDLYGLSHHNFIGSLPQNNSVNVNWIEFFIENRLEVQLKLALEGGLISEDYATGFRKIYPSLEDFFPHEKPSLLHGDLWSGNVMAASDGMPCLIDPATYYGHREMEIAFTMLFGGFDQAFYESYQEAFPLEKGFDQRADIYNLYPLLVHLNLFGSAYFNSIDRIVSKFAI